MNKMNKKIRLWVFLFVVLQTPLVGAQQASGGVEGLLELPFEQLMDVEVTSVSKRKQKIGEAAAAVYVISGEEIRRSGATTIVEALRLVPGVQIGRNSTHQWVAGPRGFNDFDDDVLHLVLIDGRTAYTPLFSGVHWDVQDTLIEDIDRIEVVRGRGGRCGVPTR